MYTIYNCINENQSGFMEHHPTSHALKTLIEDITNALVSKYIACGNFIDLHKAFDIVDHNVITEKLDPYGIRSIPNKWIQSYLKNRWQFVSIIVFQSNKVVLKFGIPQGSVFGPHNFVITTMTWMQL